MEYKPLIGEADGLTFEHYETMLRELYNQMIRVAYAKLSNKSDAQDAVQEAWLRMLQKQEMLREQDKLHAWAKTITANVAINMNRKTSRTATRSLEDNEGALDGSVPHYPREAELLMEISDLLGALDPRSRTMLLYKFYYGFKDQEIADALQLPVGTVKARIHRSKVQLKRMLQEQTNG
ncbi:RNA polymerase sigma-70 factor (ECF subfamily) [Paenibacillus phyllosphaerae]|uniref:RNA polymerase sigma-70 factor (ECF subfamily) n=1 Tax=Paenibacillus phyllosphaerae TaxID=274593 RepID=A0A7W5ATA5_9BACL|nr:RNA polymerase sigma factor [Paenibacillus phyllosphaerae]MBB3108375.1 RNA polymerase sigma-70 factor (ECF subfamily) [Paenibacillus phyllosphaerae]